MDIEIIQEDSYGKDGSRLEYIPEATISQIVAYSCSDWISLHNSRHEVIKTIMVHEENLLKVVLN